MVSRKHRPPIPTVPCSSRNRSRDQPVISDISERSRTRRARTLCQLPQARQWLQVSTEIPLLKLVNGEERDMDDVAAKFASTQSLSTNCIAPNGSVSTISNNQPRSIILPFAPRQLQTGFGSARRCFQDPERPPRPIHTQSHPSKWPVHRGLMSLVSCITFGRGISKATTVPKRLHSSSTSSVKSAYSSSSFSSSVVTIFA